MNGIIGTYNLKPSYIEREESGEMRKFQKDVLEFVEENSKRVAILDAPTGSGKTYMFKKIASNEKKAIIVLPNNLLAEEVYRDLGDNACVLNKESINRTLNERKKRDNPLYNTKSDAIEEMISSKAYIVTNPTVFYYLLINHYTKSHRDDMISILVKGNIKTVIFDEFHIYSRDQISMIFASALALPYRIKIMFSSATPQKFFSDLCKDVFGTENLEEIHVSRSYIKSENSDILQGPISVDIFNEEASIFVDKNLKLFNTGKWVIILDSLKNIDKVINLLVSKYGKEEIGLVSAYYDPLHKTYQSTKQHDNKFRIIVSSNIIEQGINLSREYINFLIEAGSSANSLVQRIGRVGRGVETESKVILCFGGGMQTTQKNIETMDDLIAFIYKLNYGKDSYSPTSFGIGVYVSLFIDKLTTKAGEAILSNIIEYDNKKINAGIYSCKNVNDTLTNREGLKIIKRNCLREIFKVSTWWEKYKDSFYNFIPSQAGKVSVVDEDYIFEGNFLKTKYDEIWINKNKEILERTGEQFVVGKFNRKPNYDFEVIVENTPLGSKKMKYKDIAFSARKDILEDIKGQLENLLCLSNDKIQTLINNIISCTKETAGLERLALEISYA